MATPIKRSTAGGAAGLIGAFAQYLMVPPTVMQEAIRLAFRVEVSVDLASLIGTVLVGILGWLAAELQTDKTETQQAKALVDTAVTKEAQAVAEQAVSENKDKP